MGIEYSDEIASRICTRLALGESLVSMCRDEDMPNVATVYGWVSKNDKFRAMYQLAREDQADTLADEIISISDETPVIVTKDEDGNETKAPILLDAAAVQRQRLRCESRKWVASKLKPKKYGDRQEIVGAGGEPLIPDTLSDFEGARRIAFVLARADHMLACGEMTLSPLQLAYPLPSEPNEG